MYYFYILLLYVILTNLWLMQHYCVRTTVRDISKLWKHCGKWTCFARGCRSWCLRRISHLPSRPWHTNLKTNGICLLLPPALIRFKEVLYLTSANSHCLCSCSFYFEISEASVFSWGQLDITAAVYLYEWSASFCPSVTHFHYNVSVAESSGSGTVTHEPAPTGDKWLYIRRKSYFYCIWMFYEITIAVAQGISPCGLFAGWAGTMSKQRLVRSCPFTQKGSCESEVCEI